MVQRITVNILIIPLLIVFQCYFCYAIPSCPAGVPHWNAPTITPLNDVALSFRWDKAPNLSKPTYSIQKWNEGQGMYEFLLTTSSSHATLLSHPGEQHVYRVAANETSGPFAQAISCNINYQTPLVNFENDITPKVTKVNEKLAFLLWPEQPNNANFGYIVEYWDSESGNEWEMYSFTHFLYSKIPSIPGKPVAYRVRYGPYGSKSTNAVAFTADAFYFGNNVAKFDVLPKDNFYVSGQTVIFNDNILFIGKQKEAVAYVSFDMRNANMQHVPHISYARLKLTVSNSINAAESIRVYSNLEGTELPSNAVTYNTIPKIKDRNAFVGVFNEAHSFTQEGDVITINLGHLSDKAIQKMEEWKNGASNLGFAIELKYGDEIGFYSRNSPHPPVLEVVAAAVGETEIKTTYVAKTYSQVVKPCTICSTNSYTCTDDNTWINGTREFDWEDTLISNKNIVLKVSVIIKGAWDAGSWTWSLNNAFIAHKNVASSAPSKPNYCDSCNEETFASPTFFNFRRGMINYPYNKLHFKLKAKFDGVDATSTACINGITLKIEYIPDPTTVVVSEQPVEPVIKEIKAPVVEVKKPVEPVAVVVQPVAKVTTAPVAPQPVPVVIPNVVPQVPAQPTAPKQQPAKAPQHHTLSPFAQLEENNNESANNQQQQQQQQQQQTQQQQQQQPQSFNNFHGNSPSNFGGCKSVSLTSCSVAPVQLSIATNQEFRIPLLSNVLHLAEVFIPEKSVQARHVKVTIETETRNLSTIKNFELVTSTTLSVTFATLTSKKRELITQLAAPIEICLRSEHKNNQKICLGFINEKTTPPEFVCEDYKPVKRGELWCGKTAHLTSFATLIQGANEQESSDGAAFAYLSITGSTIGDGLLIGFIILAAIILIFSAIVIGDRSSVVKRFIVGEEAYRVKQMRSAQKSFIGSSNTNNNNNNTDYNTLEDTTTSKSTSPKGKKKLRKRPPPTPDHSSLPTSRTPVPTPDRLINGV